MLIFWLAMHTELNLTFFRCLHSMSWKGCGSLWCMLHLGKDTQGIKGRSDTYGRTIKEKGSLGKEHVLLWEADLDMLLVPTQLLSHHLSSAGQAGNKNQKSLWVKIKTGTSLTKYDHDQNRLDLGKTNKIN